MKTSAYAVLLTALLASPVYAGECLGRTELTGKINAGAPHPHFPFIARFDSMTVTVAGNEGTITNLTCSDDAIGFTAAAHITYICSGSLVDDGDGYTVNARCAGSNGSDNNLTARLTRR